MAKLSALIRKYKHRHAEIHKGACLTLNNRIIEGTPVGITGNAKASWSGQGNFRIGSEYKFSSGLEYIVPLEYGHSPQARNPDGMLRINVRNWGQIVRDQL